MQRISHYFGEVTFGLGQMRESLPREDYLDLTRSLELSKKLSESTAESIAQAVKEWSVNKGVTHFCHWFQPMTGLTAEKHDAFISIQSSYYSELTVIERFTRTQLIQGEPDASSFPSGGMRTTFEARGYTAWDPTSPLFIIEDGGTKTLCIPSVFFGYHGEALDNKTPLLRSAQTLSKNLCKFLKLIGDVDVKSVTATLGAEQEYFLVDKDVASKRPDLMAVGRTVQGAISTKGQKLEDHYFGSIPSRVKSFMHELEQELFRLGVPIKTRHNEVAPSQFEMAPIFENVSVSADHNALAMETMKRIALRHNFLCLMHEKPYAGVNGSGKHCNWSVSNDKGENLLDPGRTPHQNLRFLAMVAVVIKAIKDHGAVLGAQVSSAGNAQRLGGNEAPPAIISVFLGQMLEDILNSVVKGKDGRAADRSSIDLGVGHIPNISRDYADRNRTSPFAFTGNKFEFRTVGSSANVAVPMSVLNAAVADAANSATQLLKANLEAGGSRDEAILKLIKTIVSECKSVLFSGDNYTQEWRDEAIRRKLPAIDTCADAFTIMGSEAATKFLVDTKVFSQNEINSRINVNLERYVTTVKIELQTLGEIVSDFVIPALEKQMIQTYSVASQSKSQSLKDSVGARVNSLEKTMNDLLNYSDELTTCLRQVEELGTPFEQMGMLDSSAIILGEKLRAAADSAETKVADEFWPLPKYREMLFHPSMV
jgi:glutamine synthetase